MPPSSPKPLVALVLGTAIALLAAAPGCGSGASNSGSGAAAASGPGGSTSGPGGAGGAGGGEGAGFGFGGQGGGCVEGQACEGGVCVGGECCPTEQACFGSCCDMGDICSFQACVTPGNDCVDADDCQPDEYCEYALGDPPMGQGGGGGMCAGGVELPTGKCLPKPPTCGPNEDPGDPPSCLEACEYVPPAASFAPQLKYSWGMEITPPYATDVMMSPIVIQLDDDDCNGVVDERDIPEIVFSTFSSGQYEANGVLRAISVEGGTLVDKWALPGVVNPTKQIAAANIDGMPGNEIVACTTTGAVVAVDATGVPLWTSPVMPCVMPSIADLDQDGDVEVVVEGGILDGATGQLEHAFSAPVTGGIVLSDITGDGKLEIVTGSQAYDDQGVLLLDTGMANTSSFPNDSDWKAPWPAVADLNGDGTAEVIVMHNLTHQLSIWRYDAAAPGNFVIVRQPVDINGSTDPSACPPGSWGNTHGGGPPTVADFNGDGTPDVALAGGVGYAVFDGALLMDPNVAGINTFLWLEPTTDCSSASTGSTVFDFNGDGVAEVVYSDELMLRVYEGPTGAVLWETCNTTATLIENPVVADIDNDGHADIVAVSNAYARMCDDGMTTRQAGIRVFSDNAWVRTRRVWNEHAYHITNVMEDGTIPQNEVVNYTQSDLNDFRLNKQPGGEFSAPDAVVSVAPSCAGEYGIAATVQNVGEAALPAGVTVGFYEGVPPNGNLVGTDVTTRALYSLESETLVLLTPNAPPDGYPTIYAIVDDNGPPHPEWTECRTDNNVSAPVSGECAIVP